MASVPTQGTTTIVIQMSENAGGETGDTINNETPSPSNPKQEGNNSTNPVKGGSNIQGKIALNIQLIKGLAKQSVNSYVSQIGLTTGDYYGQQRVEKKIETLSTLAQYGVALASGNYFAAIIMAASQGISYAFEQRAITREREIANYEAEQYAKRIGYSEGRR